MEVAIATLQANYDNLDEKIDTILSAIKENTKLTSETRDQAIKTNGRVNRLEELNEKTIMPIISDYKERRANVRGMIVLVSISGLAILSLVIFSINMYVDSIKKEIVEGISKKTIETLVTEYNLDK